MVGSPAANRSKAMNTTSSQAKAPSREAGSCLGSKAETRTETLLLFCRSVHPALIGVGWVLHDAMELERHLPTDYGDD